MGFEFLNFEQMSYEYARSLPERLPEMVYAHSLHNPLLHRAVQTARYAEMSELQAMQLAVVALVEQNNRLMGKLANQQFGFGERMTVIP